MELVSAMKEIDLGNLTGAIFAEDRIYRYALWRIWSTRKLLLLIGLNPSTANEIATDPTISRCITRAWREGFGGLLMANLYAYVSTNPKVLLKSGEFIGIENDDYIKQMVSLASKTVCGWGSFAAAKNRAKVVLEMIKEPYCLGINKDGSPKHPLYISYDKPLVLYSFKEAK